MKISPLYTLANNNTVLRNNFPTLLAGQNLNSLSCDCFFAGRLNPHNYLNEIESGNAVLILRDGKIDFTLKDNTDETEHLDLRSPIYNLLRKDKEKCKKILTRDINGELFAHSAGLSCVRTLSNYFDGESMKAIIGAKEKSGESIFIWSNGSSRYRKNRVETLLRLYGVSDKEFAKDILLNANFFYDAKKNGRSFDYCDDMAEVSSKISTAFLDDKDFLYKFFTKKDENGKMLHEYIIPHYLNLFIVDLHKKDPDLLHKILKTENSNGENYVQKCSFINSKYVRTLLMKDPAFYAKMVLVKNSDNKRVFDYFSPTSLKGRLLKGDIGNILKGTALDEKTFYELSEVFDEWKMKK